MSSTKEECESKCSHDTNTVPDIYRSTFLSKGAKSARYRRDKSPKSRKLEWIYLNGHCALLRIKSASNGFRYTMLSLCCLSTVSLLSLYCLSTVSLLSLYCLSAVSLLSLYCNMCGNDLTSSTRKSKSQYIDCEFIVD